MLVGMSTDKMSRILWFSFLVDLLLRNYCPSYFSQVANVSFRFLHIQRMDQNQQAAFQVEFFKINCFVLSVGYLNFLDNVANCQSLVLVWDVYSSLFCANA